MNCRAISFGHIMLAMSHSVSEFFGINSAMKKANKNANITAYFIANNVTPKKDFKKNSNKKFKVENCGRK